MFRKMIRTKAPSTKQSTFPINRWPKGNLQPKARSQASLLALACIAFAGPALAASAYDNNSIIRDRDNRRRLQSHASLSGSDHQRYGW